MPISMYHASVPVFLQLLGGLKRVIEKGEAAATAKKWEENTLLNWRLHPDMFTFARQVRQASEHAFGAGRAAGVAAARASGHRQQPGGDEGAHRQDDRLPQGPRAPTSSTAERMRRSPSPRAASRATSAPRSTLYHLAMPNVFPYHNGLQYSPQSPASISASATSWARCRPSTGPLAPPASALRRAAGGASAGAAHACFRCRRHRRC